MPIRHTSGTSARAFPYLLTLSLALYVVTPLPVSAQSDAEVTAAREVYKKHADSVVWVSAVLKMRGGGAFGGMMGAQEQKVEAVGTVIHESGLTVVSLMTIDPTSLMNAMFAGQKFPGQEGKVEFKSEMSGVKIRLADGKEVPGKLVLKDEDLDLAFVMPTGASAKLKHLPLWSPGGGAKDAASVDVLDRVIVLTRLGQELDRQPAVGIGHIAAVVKKPRTFYVGATETAALGVPVFTADGKPLGIMMMRRPSMEGGGLGGMFGMGRASSMAPVIIPGADVMEVAEQALANKDKPAEEGAEKDAGEEEEEPAAKKGK
jgi:hypothetical protein